MEDKQKGLQIYGDTTVLRKCQADKRFAYVVTLARRSLRRCRLANPIDPEQE